MADSDVSSRYTPEQLAALVVLMAEAREVSNGEMEQLAGFRLDGSDRRGLVELGLIECRKGRRNQFFHQLTDRGWQACRDLSGGERAKVMGPAGRALYVLLDGLQRALDEERRSPGEFFRPTIEARVRSAYKKAESVDGWVSLADIRDALSDVNRDALDDALIRMDKLPDVHVFPVANLKSLTKRDREAALRMGGEDNHALKIEDS